MTDVAIPQANAVEDVAASYRWDAGFWNEEETSGAELIRAGLLIEGQIAILEGHYENGKTAVLIDVARQWIEMGRPVLYIDYEMGKRRVRRRMKANLWDEDHLPLWHYLYMPNPEKGLLRTLVEALPEHPLIAVDSFSAAMMYLARDENSATESGNWWVTELQSIRESGATVVLIDQVKQSATSRDKYAGRGTGAKSFGADVKWFVERHEKFSPTEIGLIKLTRHKDREGVLPDELAFTVGDGDGHLTLTPAEPPKGDPVDIELIESIKDVLAEYEWQTIDAVRQKVGRAWQTIKDVLAMLEARGAVQSRATKSGKGTEYALTNVGQGAKMDINAPSLD